MSTSGPGAIFYRDGQRFVPTDLARGPWHEDSQHGSAMSGLLARAVALVPSRQAMQTTRMTVELLRAAPMAPVEIGVQVRHESKSMQLVEATLSRADEVYARAHAVRTRSVDRAVPADVNETFEIPRLDPSARVPLPSGKLPALHDALQLSPIEGFARPAMWVRQLKPLVHEEGDDPLVRVLIAVDWVYACVTMQQWVRAPERLQTRPFIAINTDNHVALTRLPHGEWVGLDASALYGPHGAGVAQARVFDEHGLLGFATQGLLQRELDKRPKAFGG
jgi:hypothetical protein